jgi:predicted amidohydrolase
VRVAGIVLKWRAGDRAANYENAKRLIREAAGHGARIVCTAESFLDGYSIRDASLSMARFRALAEPVPGGEYCSRLQRLADELDIHLIAAISERDGERVYNSAFLIGPAGEVLGRYRKRYLWGDEKHKYTGGTSFPAFATPYGKIGMMICSDRRQAAAMEELVANGADLVFCPAGGGFGQDNDRVVAQRSKEGRVPIVFVHPIEFLVTGRDGAVLTSELFGDSLDCEEGRAVPGVVRYYDLALPPKTRH